MEHKHVGVDAHYQCMPVCIWVNNIFYFTFTDVVNIFFWFPDKCKNIQALHFAPVWEMRYYYRDKHAGRGTAIGKKMYMRIVGEVPISFCVSMIVSMINPKLQSVAQSDLVCSFTGLRFPAAETKDEWTDRGLLWGISFLHHYRAGWLR